MHSVFAAPSILLESSGSVGLTFVMWTIGALVSAAGTAVYVEFGTVIDLPIRLRQLYSSPFVGLTTERWREGVLGVHIPPPTVPDHMRICFVRDLPSEICDVFVRLVPHASTRVIYQLPALLLENVNCLSVYVGDV